MVKNHPDGAVVNGITSVVTSVDSDYSTSVNSEYCVCHAVTGEPTPLLNCCQHSHGQSIIVSSTNEPSPLRTRITKRQLSLLVLIIYGNFWIASCYSLLAPFFPDEAEKKGSSPTISGLIFGVFQLVLFLTSPIYGKIMPVVTSRFLFISGMLVSGACSVLFGSLYYSPSGVSFIVTAFAVRIVEALGSSAYYVAALTSAASEFVDHRATVLSSLESVTGLGMIVGPVVGGSLFQVGGYTLPFFVLGGIIFLGVIIALIVTPCTDKQETGNLWKFMTKSSLYMYWLIIIHCFSIIGYNDATLTYNLRSFNFPIIVRSTVFIVPAGLYALGSPLWGILCDKYIDPKICCFVGTVVTAVGFLFLGPASFLGLNKNIWMVIVSLAMLGIGIGGMMISSFILALRRAVKEGLPDDVSTYALVSGVFSSMGALGAAVGPSIGGAMVDNIGYEQSTIVYFGISSIMVVVTLIHIICSCSKERVQNRENQPLLQA